MVEIQLQDLIRKSLVKLVPAGSVGLFPFSFETRLFDCEDFPIASPIVGSQLVYTEKVQVLSFIVVDVGTLVRLGKLIFPKLDRKESLTMVVSAFEEILNTASAKLGQLIAKIEGTQNAAITPPMVLDFSGENRISLSRKDSTFLKMAYQDMSIDYAVTVQMV